MSSKIIMKQIIPFLPPVIKKIISSCSPFMLDKVQEIRLREERPLMLVWSKGDVMLNTGGEAVKRKEDAYRVKKEELQQLLQTISNHSLYAFEDELRNGYLTVPGGHRIGLVGKAVLVDGRIKLQKYISGVNIRISREVIGAGEKVIHHLLGKNGCVHSTLIVSPPQCGKTTLLRDLVRLLSSGVDSYGFSGVKVGLVDERSEIAACYEGVPQNDIGIRTDVIDGCPKVQGMMLLIRSMSPQVLATDEIGKIEDAAAMEEALSAGVSVITTAHGSSMKDYRERPGLKRLFENKVFKRVIFLGMSKGVGTVERIWDEEKSRNLLI